MAASFYLLLLGKISFSYTTDEFFLKIYNLTGEFFEEKDTQSWGTSPKASKWYCHWRGGEGGS